MRQTVFRGQVLVSLCRVEKKQGQGVHGVRCGGNVRTGGLPLISYHGLLHELHESLGQRVEGAGGEHVRVHVIENLLALREEITVYNVFALAVLAYAYDSYLHAGPVMPVSLEIYVLLVIPHDVDLQTMLCEPTCAILVFAGENRAGRLSVTFLAILFELALQLLVLVNLEYEVVLVIGAVIGGKYVTGMQIVGQGLAGDAEIEIVKEYLAGDALILRVGLTRTRS